MTAVAIPTISPGLLAREADLLDWFRARGSALVGFSGGVDSVYLACIALEALGPERMLAVIGRSASVAAEQWKRATDVARERGIPLLVVDTGEVDDPRYAANPTNRCYFCKSVLWQTLLPIARERGFAVVVDGTNADDTGDYRPGARAAGEQGIDSPLAELGFSKEDVRALSRARDLPTWSQPSSPCLASRIPYGTAVTAERLAKVDAAERALRVLGVVGNLRVRYHGDLARVELDAERLAEWLAADRWRPLSAAVRSAGFTRVSIDLRGFRSGSLNVLGGVVPA